MTNEENGQTDEHTYEKPVLRVIELAAEEVLAAGCKTLLGGGAIPQAMPCDAMRCSKIGS